MIYMIRETARGLVLGFFALALILTLLLGGCATGGSGPTPRAVVASLQASLTAADGVALQYVRLPRCPAKTVCSDPVVVASIKAQAQAARDNLVAAQDAATADPAGASTATQAAITSARAAMAAFSSRVNALPVGAKP